MIIYSYYLFHSSFDAWNNRKTLFVISTEITKILLKFLLDVSTRICIAFPFFFHEFTFEEYRKIQNTQFSSFSKVSFRWERTLRTWLADGLVEGMKLLMYPSCRFNDISRDTPSRFRSPN